MQSEDVRTAIQRFLRAGGVISVTKPGRAAGIPAARIKVKGTSVRRNWERTYQGYAILNYDKLTNR